ncbi:hypothetical protein AAur_3453 [Paenarthrobacter aurescens TC1]|uniref:GH16 domain-containing protein n=2 Tax=Paenarthrobacter aurescens TaxID=43663 RepID=A1RA84_PAEAT|nr:hypothetical protein AAur_3453 [Paenarthrobacter aurescens TC1]
MAFSVRLLPHGGRKAMGLAVVVAVGLSMFTGIGPSHAADTTPMAEDPGPVGSFAWKGFNWQKRFWGGAPMYNASWDANNVSNPDANGYVKLSISNPTGSAPKGAEFQSTREGFGYGTYSTTVEKDVSSLQKEVVWGCLFTYDPNAVPGYTEIDLCEASAWGGGAAYGEDWPVTQGHGYWFDATLPPGQGNNTVTFDVTNAPILTHRMVWEPGKLTYETFAGEGYDGTLLKRTVLEGSTVPLPAKEQIHFNLWVTGGGGGDAAHVAPETVTIRDFSFVPANQGQLTAPTPTISGTAAVGSTLTAAPGTWTTGTALGYQWFRNGTAIVGATSATRVLAAADQGTSLTVRVTGTKAGYATAVRESAPTATVVAGTLVAPTPIITGTPTVGSTLTANPGTWTSGSTLTYQWLRSGVAIPGATARSYKLVSADQADAMSVRVTGAKAGYTTVVKFSASTALVQ